MTDAPAPPASPPVLETPLQLRVAMFCMMLATFMQALDQTIAVVALPHMQGSLQAGRDEITWVLTSYIIASAIMTTSVGWISTRFGRKNLATISVIGFTVTSALCGAAQSLHEMILFRLLQGLCGASLIPLSQALVLDRYPLEKRGQVLSAWSAVVSLGPILGPTLGAWLTEAYSWRWVFYINVPIGVLTAVGLILCLKEPPRFQNARFDAFGFVTVSLALGALQLVLDRGTRLGWFDSSEIVLEAIIGGVASYLFLVHICTTRGGIFPTALLRDRNYVFGVVLTFVVGALIISTAALLPPYLQTLGGYSVLEAGLLLAPRGLGSLVAFQIVARVVLRTDPRHLIIGGSILTIVTMWQMARWTPAVDALTVGVTATIQGFGIGFMFMPTNFLCFSTLKHELRTDGASWLTLGRSIGSALGISITSTVISIISQEVHSELTASLTPFNRSLSVGAQGLFWNPAIPFGAQALDDIVNWNAAVVGYSDAFLLMFFLSITAPAVAILMRKPPAATPSAPSAPVVE